MTIKKLTVAAAIAVGIATCSFSSAIAKCPIKAPCACPAPCATTCPTPCVTPCSDPCPAPCATSCPTPCATPCCDPCPAPCAKPSCATCPSTSCADLDMKQVYAYPNAIYGDNNYVGQQTNAIYSTETAWMLDCCDSLAACKAGLPIGAAAPLGYGYNGLSCGCNPTPCECAIGGVPVFGPCGRGYTKSCGCGCNTGCAAPCDCMPIINKSCASGCGCTGAAASCGCGCHTTIQTSDSMQAIERSFSASPCVSSACPSCSTGAAAPTMSVFHDVPDGYWAGCAIDRLACTNVIAGYPDRSFKPALPVSRAEFASMMVKGFNLNLDCPGLSGQKMFKDVTCNHWANPVIAKAVQEGIMCGYPNKMFKPKSPVSRVEALTAMAHGINCDIDSCKAQEILNQYCDGNKVPDWAQIPVAKALQSGILKDSPNPNTINPCKDASRAEIASMLQTVRIASGYDCLPTACKPACESDCPSNTDCGCTQKTTYVETEKVVDIPTLKVKFQDEINAKSSHVGQQFAAITTEEITINGKCYPCGSRVNGKIVEIIRPSGCQKGALKVAFTNIQDCNNCKCDLPRQILSAQINCDRKQNAVARFVSMPFTLFGTLVGTTGRTIGGMISNAGNAVESVSSGTGIAMGEVFQGQFRAAGRSLQDAGKEAIIAPVDFARTALSGTMGLFQTTGDEVAYLVDPSGTKISAINPKEEVTIAFGCSE